MHPELHIHFSYMRRTRPSLNDPNHLKLKKKFYKNEYKNYFKILFNMLIKQHNINAT